MSFVTKTIADIMQDMDKGKYVLPAIQREFVWDTKKIELLFDSLMQDYPISTFLFWDIEKNTSNYKFYEFIRDYHERDRIHNIEADLKGRRNVTAVLDGQQRLTAFYIGLKGSHTLKKLYKRWSNDSEFQKKYLYLNLLAPAEDFEKKFNFKFLTEKEQESYDLDKGYLWFPVGEILDFGSAKRNEVKKYLVAHRIKKTDGDIFKFANETLLKIFDVIHKNKSIHFFLEKSTSLHKVLDIFVRANSGGKPLSYSDLLLSIATAHWENKNAREEIYSFVDEIKTIGSGFNFNKDFVLKSCLVLSDFTDIAFKVDNFVKANMLKIENDWEKISESLRTSVNLVASFGFEKETLTSNNAIIPIAYYIKQIGNPSNFVSSRKYKNDRETIFKWLLISLLKRIFSGQPDNVLKPIRKAIQSSTSTFPFDKIVSKLDGGTKDLQFNDANILKLLEYKYSGPHTYATLALIYPTLDFSNKFHQDHIFPKKLFNANNLKKKNIPEEKWDDYLGSFDLVGNIQLLRGTMNQEKSDKDFDVWIKEEFPQKNRRQEFMKTHYIPDVDLSFDNYLVFLKERKKLLVTAFKERFSSI